MNDTSYLRGGHNVEFLGRAVRRGGNNDALGCEKHYADEDIRAVRVQNCVGRTTPGTVPSKHPGGASLLRTEGVEHYRPIAGAPGG